MKIVLIGYMGSGKSTIGNKLASLLGMKFIDLDSNIEEIEGASISKLFVQKGEIYFRKKEREVLEQIINNNQEIVLATGGGTPCFGNTMEFLNHDKDVVSIYLKASIDLLTERLFKEKNSRPLISHLKTKDAIKDFISKHLFERSYYYNQAAIKVEIDNLLIVDIVKNIKQRLLT